MQLLRGLRNPLKCIGATVVILAWVAFLSSQWMLSKTRIPTVQSEFSVRKYEFYNRSNFNTPRSIPRNFSLSTSAAPDSRNEVITIFILPDKENFMNHLQKASDSNKTVVLSVVDSRVIDLALNFIVSSINPLKIRNYLPVCLDENSLQTLATVNISCYLYPANTTFFGNVSDFGSKSYYLKTNIKTIIALTALKLGFHILVADVDIVLFRDPFPYFQCLDCDIHAQVDRVMINSGFIFVRATKESIKLYEIAWSLYRKYQKSHDQAYLNDAVQLQLRSSSLNIHELSSSLFQCGLYYFEHSFRMFYNLPPCKDCVMVHNNYIGSQAAKKYRFKENLMWHVDTDGYYSDAKGRFITYENPEVFEKNQRDKEIQALKTALFLADVTKRQLILPTFRCCRCDRDHCDHPKHRCSLLSMVRLNLFDDHFKEIYREHSFLNNTLVPSGVMSFITPELFINSTHFGDSNVKTLRNTTSLLEWINSYKDFSVIRFKSLYDGVELNKTFEAKLERGIQCARYDQWNPEAESIWI